MITNMFEPMLGKPSGENTFLEELIRPETELERQLIMHNSIQEGMMWGKPRYGHPEGQVYNHIREVLDNIEALELSAKEREQLRLIAIVHDSFKNIEDNNRPRDWNRHHAVLARRFMDDFIEDELMLTIIQWHDEAYYIWRDMVVAKDKKRASFRMERLLGKLKEQTQLYYLFFYCDSKTGDKNPAPVIWIEENLPGIVKL